MLDVQTLTAERYERRLERTAKQQGWGSSDGAFAIIDRFLSGLTEIISEELGKTKDDDLGGILQDLGPELLGLLGLQVGLDSVAREDTLNQTLFALGKAVQWEVIGRDLTKFDKGLSERIEKAAKRRYGSVKLRRQALMSMARKNGYRRKDWSQKGVLKAGTWVLNTLLRSDVFVADGAGNLTVTQDALAVSDAMVTQMITRYPVFLPLLAQPEPWTSLQARYYPTREVKIMRGSKVSMAALRVALAEGTLQPTLDALTAVQSTPWAINEPMLELVRWAYDNDVKVKDFVLRTDLPMPDYPAPWEEMNADQRKLWRRDAAKIGEKNRGFVGQRWTFAKDVAVAEWTVEGGNRFWTPHNFDSRGRVYPVCHFSFQRGDYVRSLFRFAEGKPLGAEGLYWLKVHVANCGDFDKVSKRPFDERVAWVDDNLDHITHMAAYPTTELWWTQADSPFMFLAAATELLDALNNWEGPEAYVSHLPISFDGSCSGLQHLSAMTRAAEGELVNLKHSDLPQDVYQRVADLVKARVEADLGGENDELARMSLGFGIDRKLVKRNVMTYSYSSKASGMAEQLRDDTMAPLSDKVLTGELAAHPFLHPSDTFVHEETGDSRTVPGYTASLYLAKITYASVEATVPKAAEAMRFLQKLATACAHEGQTVRWTTPMGLPVVDVRYVMKAQRTQLYLYDRGTCRAQSWEETKELDKARMRSRIAPNFVHSMDACHLMMVATEAAKEGISLALVHDSFGCHAADATRLRSILTGTLTRMYQDNDVLAQILVETQERVEDTSRLPDLPEYGSLDLSQLKDAQYAFA